MIYEIPDNIKYILTPTTLCPGKYCGRILYENGSWSDCGACPRGYRTNETSICVLCVDTLSLYDWLYLGFMTLLLLVLHWFFIDMVSMRKSFNKDVLILHGSAFLETVLASILTLLLIDPMGSLQVRSCPIKNGADWYTLFHNPNLYYKYTLHCTQEAVYPLYTAVFMLYGFALLIMLVIRPWICSRCMPKQSKMSIYAAMYFIPILGLAHAIGAGVLYYSFPFITVVASVVSNAAHFALRQNQAWKALFLETVTDVRNLVILLGHWSLHAYGIIGIATYKKFMTNPGFLLFLVPLPASFYISTALFTDPNKIVA